MVLGAAMAASLYDPAFATLGRIFGAGARGPITTLTLAGGFASTVSWPATQFLIDKVGWRGTYLVYAALLALVAAPLHAFALPRRRAEIVARPAPALRRRKNPRRSFRRTGWPLFWSPPVLPPMPSYRRRCRRSFSPSSRDLGWRPTSSLPSACYSVRRRCWRASASLALAATCIRCGSRAPPSGYLVAAFVLLALLPFSAAVAATFAVMFGMANGLLTIARGTVPLALFGPSGYGRLVGRIGGPFLAVQALAPVIVTYVADRASDAAGLTLVAAFAVAAFICFLMIRAPE